MPLLDRRENFGYSDDKCTKEGETVADPDIYISSLRSLMSSDFYDTRKRLNLSQAKMAERLLIDPRSYVELEHGRNLCCTRVFMFYLFRCKTEREPFLLRIEETLNSLEGFR